MRFALFREFRPNKAQAGSLIGEVVNYLQVDLVRSMKDLTVGLRNLNFTDNFQSFEVQISIDPGQELAIQNTLVQGLVPTKRIVVRGGEGSESIVDGDTEWTTQFVYLKNVGTIQANATVVFLR